MPLSEKKDSCGNGVCGLGAAFALCGCADAGSMFMRIASIFARECRIYSSIAGMRLRKLASARSYVSVGPRRDQSLVFCKTPSGKH